MLISNAVTIILDGFSGCVRMTNINKAWFLPHGALHSGENGGRE